MASMRTDGSQIQNPSNYLWPVTLAHGALDWMFLSEIDEQTKLTPGRPIKIRDGLIPMAWFFYNNPEPVAWNRKILVHHSLFRHVPTAWRNLTGVYDMGVQASPGESTAIDELLLLGVASENFCELDRLQEILSQVEDRLAHFPAVSKVSAYIAVPPWLDQVPFQAEYFGTLSRALSRKIHFWDWYKFCGRKNLSKLWVVDLNGYTLCADSYLYQWALTHGAKSFFPVQEGFIAAEDLSINHRYYIRENLNPTPPPPAEEIEARRMLRLLMSSSPSPLKSNQFPWSAGFEHWCRHLSASGHGI
jgi:hypothetical protein